MCKTNWGQHVQNNFLNKLGDTGCASIERRDIRGGREETRENRDPGCFSNQYCTNQAVLQLTNTRTRKLAVIGSPKHLPSMLAQILPESAVVAAAVVAAAVVGGAVVGPVVSWCTGRHSLYAAVHSHIGLPSAERCDVQAVSRCTTGLNPVAKGTPNTNF